MKNGEIRYKDTAGYFAIYGRGGGVLEQNDTFNHSCAKSVCN